MEVKLSVLEMLLQADIGDCITWEEYISCKPLETIGTDEEAMKEIVRVLGARARGRLEGKTDFLKVAF